MTIRIHKGIEAEASRTPVEGGALGWAAVVMLAVCLIGRRVLPSSCAPVIERFARVWTGGLFCFFAGVHRGASFYNPKGPQVSDPVIFLAMHFLGLSTFLFSSRLSWRLATAGMLATLAGDVHLARQNRLPHFFLRLRPMQLLVATVFLILLTPSEHTKVHE